MSDDQFLWHGSPDAPAPLPPARRRANARGLVAAGAIGLAAGIGTVIALSGTGTPAGPSYNSVARAASATASQAGFRFTMDIAVTVGGRAAEIQASGAATERPAPALSMSMTVAGVSYNAVFVPPWEYVEVGGNWLKINHDAYQQAIGAGGLSPTGSDPSQILRFLAATGTVTTVGTPSIDGVPTTHYHAVTDLGRYAATVPASERQAAATSIATLEHELGGTTLPIDAWIDGQHRVRRIAFALGGICTTSGPADESITLDLFGYGPQAPPAVPSSALDITSQAAAGAAAQRQRALCPA